MANNYTQSSLVLNSVDTARTNAWQWWDSVRCGLPTFRVLIMFQRKEIQTTKSVNI